jgi:hypothetical protein
VTGNVDLGQLAGVVPAGSACCKVPVFLFVINDCLGKTLETV